MLQSYHPMGEGAKIGADSCVNKGDEIGIILFGDMWSRAIEGREVCNQQLKKSSSHKNSGQRLQIMHHCSTLWKANDSQWKEGSWLDQTYLTPYTYISNYKLIKKWVAIKLTYFHNARHKQ